MNVFSCNTLAKPTTPVKLALVGNDALVAWSLRSYVELFSSKTPEWSGYVRIYVVPLGKNFSEISRS